MYGHYVTSVEELREFYAAPSEAVRTKNKPFLDEWSRAFLSDSPYLIMATSGEAGTDCSPRGDEPGFVGVEDDGQTLLIPDRPGNNRLDSLSNIVENPKVGILFLVPGQTFTLRVNGSARLSMDPALIERFTREGKAPRGVIVVAVEEAYMHCARSLLQADLWNPERLTNESETLVP